MGRLFVVIVTRRRIKKHEYHALPLSHVSVLLKREESNFRPQHFEYNLGEFSVSIAVLRLAGQKVGDFLSFSVRLMSVSNRRPQP